MSRELSFLIVDDDAEKRFLIVYHLRREFEGVQLIECDSGAAAIAHLEKQPVHALVTDNSMSPVNGLELIMWLRERDLKMPVVMVTGNPEIERVAIKAGASVVVSSQRFREVGAILKQLLRTENPNSAETS
jgi:DNA-binding response OmpR family regulator